MGGCRRKSKVKRRQLHELPREFSCPYSGCGLFYSSNSALNLHIQLKHNGGTQTFRNKMAEISAYIVIANNKIPDLPIDLPPGLIESWIKRIEDDNKPRKMKRI